MSIMYKSTRSNSEKVTASQAILKGLADDGGLFVPDSIPALDVELEKLAGLSYQETAYEVMKLFLSDFTKEELLHCIHGAYDDKFDTKEIAPLVKKDGAFYLELFHGKTIAFKDMALSILPYLMTTSAKKNGVKNEIVILTATSGDTGKAALAGFADVEGTSIIVFYPKNGVSPIQEKQMLTQKGKNTNVVGIIGNFDDAQTGVKQIFGDAAFAEQLSAKGWFLSSANSINWGRLLPQIVYYFSAYCDYANSGRVNYGDAVDFVVPTGNFGNILACWYAKNMGLPVGKLICASNQNNVLADFFSRGVYDRNRTFYTTISPSMDILISSNLERLLYSVCGSDTEVAGYMAELAGTGRYEVSDAVKAVIGKHFVGGYCSDDETKSAINKVYTENGYLMDTHTAVAYNKLAAYRKDTGCVTPAVVVSTASPYKFCNSVLQALGQESDAPGTELIEKLSEVTKTAIPKPLEGLDRREKRFELVVDKPEMKATVADFLK